MKSWKVLMPCRYYNNSMYSEDVVEDARGVWPCKVSRRQLLKSVSVTDKVKAFDKKNKDTFPMILYKARENLADH